MEGGLKRVIETVIHILAATVKGEREKKSVILPDGDDIGGNSGVRKKQAPSTKLC